MDYFYSTPRPWTHLDHRFELVHSKSELGHGRLEQFTEVETAHDLDEHAEGFLFGHLQHRKRRIINVHLWIGFTFSPDFGFGNNCQELKMFIYESDSHFYRISVSEIIARNYKCSSMNRIHIFYRISDSEIIARNYNMFIYESDSHFYRISDSEIIARNYNMFNY